MGAFRFLTAGESHGPTLGVTIEGVPAGLALTEEDLLVDLARRQRGYGRGARQAPIQDRRGSSLFVIKIVIPRRQSQSRLGARGRQDNYLARESEIANHLPDHNRLLRVLLTKESKVRPDDVEQQSDDSRHAAKMSRPRRAFELS